MLFLPNLWPCSTQKLRQDFTQGYGGDFVTLVILSMCARISTIKGRGGTFKCFFLVELLVKGGSNNKQEVLIVFFSLLQSAQNTGNSRMGSAGLIKKKLSKSLLK